MSKKVFVGVDGCSAGWFAVFLVTENEKNCKWKVGLFPKFSSLIDFLKKEYEQAEFLDPDRYPYRLESRRQWRTAFRPWSTQNSESPEVQYLSRTLQGSRLCGKL